MYARSLNLPIGHSYFLFGPRGVGKSDWVRKAFPAALTIDLLDARTYQEYRAAPERLWDRIATNGLTVIDEVQKVPELLNEVHRCIEQRGAQFVLTGSSARTLRRRGVNLLAGRALLAHMHPLVAEELGEDFNLQKALRFGLLPKAVTSEMRAEYLAAYTSTYLREEVQQEGLLRNIGAFARFLEIASFSQGSLLNVANVSRDVGIAAKVAGDYFNILDDLLISIRLSPFTRKSKRKIVAHQKFYYFDAGVFRAVRPRGPLDEESEMAGPALETLVLQHLRAINDYHSLGFSLSFWRTQRGDEIDFILYGEKGLLAIEVKHSDRVRREDLAALELFGEDYSVARKIYVYGGNRRYVERGIELWPAEEFFRSCRQILGGELQA